MPKTYKVGTRGSLLALTQCHQILDELKEKTGHQFETEIIKTQGDLNTSVPLWQLEGENFFTKELDAALLEKRVDFVVHSYKDLGSKRPVGIKIGAITKRKFAHDILLFRKDVIKNIAERKELIIGTSSPRRCVNIERHLKDFLPKQGLEVKTKPLRGNVNTRVEKLNTGDYDGIVLALAGLERLAMTNSSRKELGPLVKDLEFMVLPLSYFPSSASQGALALECLEQNTEIITLLNTVHDDDTFEEVSRERKIFNEFGGGCHLSVGINVRKKDNGLIHFIEGEFEGERVQRNYLETDEEIKIKFPLFVGLPPNKELKIENCIYDEIFSKKSINEKVQYKAENIFVSSNYCIDWLESNYKGQTLWSSGIKTMQKLAQKGYWVHGSSDSLGEDEIENLKNSEFLSLIKGNISKDWLVLTHKESKTRLGDIATCYERIESSGTADFDKKIEGVHSFYWTSFNQFKKYCERYPYIKTRNHFCGLGKTYEAFKKEGLNVSPIFNIKSHI